MPPSRTSPRTSLANTPYILGQALVRSRDASVLTNLTSDLTDLTSISDLTEVTESTIVNYSLDEDTAKTISTRSRTKNNTPSSRKLRVSKSTTSLTSSTPVKSKGVTLQTVTVNGVQLNPTVAFDTFWRFSAERKAIDDRRRAGQPAPWTDDPILQRFFFCNTYRVLDKLCQYLITHVIEKGSQDPTEIVFRVVLFNTFTKIETWELLLDKVGDSVHGLTWANYDREKYDRVLSTAKDNGQALYTAAFIKPAPKFKTGANFKSHLCLLEILMENELPSKLLAAPSMADVYEYLVSFPGMGDFTTYQLMLNLSYTNILNFHPNDFTIAGPGAISGLAKLFGKSFLNAYQDDKSFSITLIRWLVDTQNEHFARLGLEFSGLGKKRLPMDVSDVEHVVCEVDKYCRKKHPSLKGVGTRHELKHVYHGPDTKTWGSGKGVGGGGYPAQPAIPKAWSHPARKMPRIREAPLVVEKRYEVDYITTHRYINTETKDIITKAVWQANKASSARQFRVYWVGYEEEDASWEYEDSLMQDAPTVVKEYLTSARLCAAA